MAFIPRMDLQQLQPQEQLRAATIQYYFNTGNGTLTLQTGALLIGPASGGNSSHIILEGTGSASNDFLIFGSLDMTGSEWTLLGRTEARAITVSNGRLIIGQHGSSGAVLSTDTVSIQPGTEMVGYNSTIEGAVITMEYFLLEAATHFQEAHQLRNLIL